MNMPIKAYAVFVVLLLICPPMDGFCQSNFILESQAGVDIFGRNATDSIQGNLIIRSTGIQQLNALLSIKHISGNLYIHGNGRIKDLHGLDSLRSTGGALILQDNDRLINLQGLGKLEKIGTFVTIEGNESLINLEGLGPVTEINRNFTVLQNAALINLKGMEGITHIQGTIEFCDNPLLKNFLGLNQLKRVGRNVYIYHSAAMQDMSGLNDLANIGGELDLGENKSLVSLRGLGSLRSIGDCLYIFNNPSLVSIEDLRNLHEIGGTMTIIFNKQLTQCEARGLCSYFLHRSSGINIWENGQLCSDKKTIQLPCLQSQPIRNIVSNPVRVFPTRTQNAVFIEGMDGLMHQIQIFNTSGQLMLKLRSDHNEPFHLAEYPNGTYFIAIESPYTRSVHQVIKW